MCQRQSNTSVSPVSLGVVKSRGDDLVQDLPHDFRQVGHSFQVPESDSHCTPPQVETADVDIVFHIRGVEIGQGASAALQKGLSVLGADEYLVGDGIDVQWLVESWIFQCVGGFNGIAEGITATVPE